MSSRTSSSSVHGVHASLDVKVKKGHIDQLIALLEAMILARIKASTCKKLSHHLKSTVALLKPHRVIAADSLLQRIEEGSDQWREIKQIWSNVQDKTAPLQQEEIARLRKVEDDVQYHCASLASIFISSDDIRNQLLK